MNRQQFVESDHFWYETQRQLPFIILTSFKFLEKNTANLLYELIYTRPVIQKIEASPKPRDGNINQYLMDKNT